MPCEPNVDSSDLCPLLNIGRVALVSLENSSNFVTGIRPIETGLGPGLSRDAFIRRIGTAAGPRQAAILVFTWNPRISWPIPPSSGLRSRSSSPDSPEDCGHLSTIQVIGLCRRCSCFGRAILMNSCDECSNIDPPKEGWRTLQLIHCVLTRRHSRRFMIAILVRLGNESFVYKTTDVRISIGHACLQLYRN